MANHSYFTIKTTY